jgi:hypothetical protein
MSVDEAADALEDPIMTFFDRFLSFENARPASATSSTGATTAITA